jgi:hypothetical protein
VSPDSVRDFPTARCGPKSARARLAPITATCAPCRSRPGERLSRREFGPDHFEEGDALDQHGVRPAAPARGQCPPADNHQDLDPDVADRPGVARDVHGELGLERLSPRLGFGRRLIGIARQMEREHVVRAELAKQERHLVSQVR